MNRAGSIQPFFVGDILDGSPGFRVEGGSRIFVGGLEDTDAYTYRDNPHEVLIPPGRCVYYWLGCEHPRWRRNYCHGHYRETQAEEGLDGRRNRVQPMCTEGCGRRSTSRSELCSRCGHRKRGKAYFEANKDVRREYQRAYRAANLEKENARKREWRQGNREHVAAYERTWRARQKVTV